MALDITKSESKVIKLKAQGYLEKQICDMLYISIHTVKMHVKNALKRNHLNNGFELVARYAATHPELFRNMIVAIFLGMQFSIIYTEAVDIEKVFKTKVSKTRRAKRSRTYYI